MDNAVELLKQWATYEPLGDIAASAGLPIDQLNYVFCLVLAYPLSFLFSLIPTSAVNTRHFVAGFIGLLFGVFCFRVYILHVLVLAGGVYTLILLDPSAKNMQKYVAVFSVAYLVLCHLYRQYYHFGLYLLDITGPLMILVEKLSALGFSIHDAKHPSAKGSDIQKKLAVAKVPNVLEYFGHVFFFPGFLAGPLHFYVDYEEFIQGKNTKGGELVAAIQKFFFAILCIGINKLPGIVGFDSSILLLIKDEFVTEHSFLYRVVHLYVACVCIRMQYYFAWILADGANNLAGFGSQVDAKTGVKNWNKITNVNVLEVEFATNLKGVLDNWNIQTQTWLRYVCYERTNNSVYKTMMLSALWHGLYPGYFLTFLTAALQTEAARKARRVIRPVFHGFGKGGAVFYDILTWASTAFILNYMVGPFVVLELWGSLQFWTNFQYVGHVAAIIFVLVLQGGGEKKPKDKGDKAAAEVKPAKQD